MLAKDNFLSDCCQVRSGFQDYNGLTAALSLSWPFKESVPTPGSDPLFLEEPVLFGFSAFGAISSRVEFGDEPVCFHDSTPDCTGRLTAEE